VPRTQRIVTRGWIRIALAAAIWVPALPAAAAGPELSDAQKRKLDENYRLCLSKEKGPYTQNYCVCQNGERQPVQTKDGRVGTPCGGKMRFCAAWRAPWGEALAQERVYVANLFARDLYEWDAFPDPNDLVRGYILEKYLVETEPAHKFAVMRSYGGLGGSEYEARDAPLFFERYLADERFREPRLYLLAYELQRRYFVRNDQGQIQRARALAVAIQTAQPSFKPLRDATHNQISADLIPKLAAYRARMAAGPTRDRVDELIAEIRKLTSLDESSLRTQLPAFQDAALRGELEARLPAADADPIDATTRLADLMVFARRTVEAKQVSPADARRLIDLSITAAAVLQRRGTDLLAAGTPLPARRHVEWLVGLTDAAYGAGLVMERERTAAVENLRTLLGESSWGRVELDRRLDQAERVVEWAQRGVQYSFEEVRAAWSHLMPETALLGDDVLRGSPLLLYGQVLERLENFATGSEPVRHEIFGASFERDVRALNPGLAFGRLRVSPEPGSYSRADVVALPETPADLEPAAGIVTRGEGNVVSHVQLLARALGIPNAVVGPRVYEQFPAHQGHDVFLLVTPGGRVVVKDGSKLGERDRAVLDEYTRNQARTGTGSLGHGGAKLHIARERLDLSPKLALDLASVRRADSGVRCGPKAAYLGELKHLFPDKVARGVVVPFGAYYEHYQRATVHVPPALAGRGIAQAGEPLSSFVERTYQSFFGEMIPRGTQEKELGEWIRPRLDVIRASLQETPLSPELEDSIRAELARQGLLRPDDPSQTVGLFVRSDTNVEDLDNFNGAGLNLTLFNRKSVEDVFAALKEVWASPFTYRSFSWRQTLIDEPLWVLPSVVLLESVPNDRSGVLVTADIDHGDPDGMLVATSEGVGGAVDGSAAETLLWSPSGAELVTMFKSPWRQMLQPGGGSAVVAATGQPYVLEPRELEELVATAQIMRGQLEPSIDASGRARPWDVEFGFASGKLWLFQVRPFVGNDALKNVPALAAYDGNGNGRVRQETLSSDAMIP
jgi:hypothetical protein